MAITTLAQVKIVAGLFDRSGSSAPTTATFGEVGDYYMNTTNGLTYVLSSITTTPSTLYNWTADTRYDATISSYIARAESDYLAIRGIAFDLAEDGTTIVYPTSASIVAAEMICYLAGLARFDGRGAKSESLSGRNATYDGKVKGYPVSIVGCIERYHSAS